MKSYRFLKIIQIKPTKPLLLNNLWQNYSYSDERQQRIYNNVEPTNKNLLIWGGMLFTL